MHFSRRAVLGFLMYSVADVALADAPVRSVRPARRSRDAVKRSQPGIGDLVRAANLGGAVSCLVADARTGVVLEGFEPSKALPPASVTKAVTTMYALEAMGPEFRFATRLIATGPVSGGVLKGDLVLVGGGDPTLDTNDLNAMAGRLKEAGVQAVSGKFRVTSGGLPTVERIDGAQPDHVGYNPAVSGLNLNFNRVYLEWKRSGGGYQVGMDARSNRIKPGVAVAKTTVSDRQAPVFKYSSTGGRDNWSVARGALGNAGGRWLPVRHPEIYAGDVLQTVARSHGIKLPYPQKIKNVPRGTVLVRHVSEPLAKICRDMLKFSNNLTAEVLGLQTSGAGRLTTSGGKMTSWLKARHGVRNAKFVDHSGLGERSAISSAEMVKALLGSGASGPLRPLLKEVAVRDDQGRPIQNGPIKVVAKTGTLNFVSALAGFIRTPDGRDLVFAFFAADVARRQGLSKAEKERPRGARTYNGRAKRLQQQLIRRWATVHGS
ncbi:MAG: D-alanyl-D-alanine carboxypeptidase/D-alanyl-D-alanine-endopeptidase [Litoreibacter sp.]